ncbi:MAG: hypothetical protein ABIN05_07895 [candidate division WOR-3 bacterium]
MKKGISVCILVFIFIFYATNSFAFFFRGVKAKDVFQFNEREYFTRVFSYKQFFTRYFIPIDSSFKTLQNMKSEFYRHWIGKNYKEFCKKTSLSEKCEHDNQFSAFCDAVGLQDCTADGFYSLLADEELYQKLLLKKPSLKDELTNFTKGKGIYDFNYNVLKSFTKHAIFHRAGEYECQRKDIASFGKEDYILAVDSNKNEIAKYEKIYQYFCDQKPLMSQKMVNEENADIVAFEKEIFYYIPQLKTIKDTLKYSHEKAGRMRHNWGWSQEEANVYVKKGEEKVEELKKEIREKIPYKISFNIFFDNPHLKVVKYGFILDRKTGILSNYLAVVNYTTDNERQRSTSSTYGLEFVAPSFYLTDLKNIDEKILTILNEKEFPFQNRKFSVDDIETDEICENTRTKRIDPLCVILRVKYNENVRNEVFSIEKAKEKLR